MEITVAQFLIILLLAFVCEFIDSSLGMGYGTILTPVLLIIGFEPLVVVPSILLSQAFGGLSASVFHHQFHNANFSRNSKDFKAFLYISGFGIIATIIAALISINIPKVVLTTYIGVLVLSMGILVLVNRSFTFSWKKLIGIGILSAFNKGMSGGGFGPVVTGGQILAGQDHKAAIGVTTLAEAPICLVGFMTFLIGRTLMQVDGRLMTMPFAEFAGIMFSTKILQWELLLALMVGSIFVTPFGAFTTRSISKKYMHFIVGVIITVLGIWTLYKVYF